MMRMRRNPSGRNGGAAIEMAFALPVALLFVAGLLEFGRIIWTQTTLDYAEESAARCASINSSLCGTAAAVQSFAVRASAGLAVTASNFALSTPSCGSMVTASLPYSFAVPWLFPYSLTLTSSACFPLP